MNESELFTVAHTALREARRTCLEPDRRAYLDEAMGAMWARLQDARRQSARVWVFDCSAPGYITLGEQGVEQIHQSPDLPGLLDAWRIFAFGVGAGGILHATDFVGNVGHPANALRNRLARAAQWIEREAHCSSIAQALRSPAIRIKSDGSIQIGARPHIELMA
jgi:hypothetical protein